MKTAYFLIFTSFLFSCKSARDKVSQLMEKGSSVVSGTPSSEDDKQPFMSTLPTEELDKKNNDLFSCQADLKNKEAEAQVQQDSAFQKGKASCINDQQLQAASERQKMEKEFEATVDNAVKKFKPYLSQAAFINGECIVQESTGKRFYYTVVEGCFNLTTKLIGVDGELVGIQDAVSSYALSLGISKISCEHGPATIRYLAKKCDETATNSLTLRKGQEVLTAPIR